VTDEPKVTIEPVGHVRDLSFACHCFEDGKAEIDEVWEWAAALNPRYNTDRLKTLNYALYQMDDWGVQWSFATDVWAGVWASNEDWKGEFAIPIFSAVTACDSIPDGMIFTFKKFHDHYEGKSSHELREEGKHAAVDQPGDQV
jgi:hypothetical protein